ncbi:MAG TPA: type I CRISPR-associated protein Cas7 [Candidatus Kapabacteria bacterium]|jgi:CRISPR-associated protein Csh2|nr:type I CRISPR-associated protein Cas7 [Candidatus Kapabacteria bacterium]HOM05903.1 type I CRISPR-associated protein Cas7 [Candidatus Kapabacteria bacterium]
MLQEFKNRVFGAVIVRSINSNFNADFTHNPRTLPDGVVYSTDKALKYAIKDYFRKSLPNSIIFYIKRFNENLNPLSLDETYQRIFGDFPKKENKNEIDRKALLEKLLTALDIRLFGATFAGKTNISIHGPVQVNHGVNKFPENEIYNEDILSPFADKEGAQMSTIGNQTNLKEGHYVFHFSINPKNTEEFYNMINQGKPDNEILCLSNEDIVKLKEAMNRGVTLLDSSRKIGSENEATIWVQLKEGSKKVLPSFTELINVSRDGETAIIDCSKVETTLKEIEEDIETIEIYYNPITTKIIGCPKGSITKHFNILNNQEI